MAKRSLFSRLLDGLRAFRSDKSGNVVITFALAIIPIIGFAGAAVDYSRANSAKAAMQAALDSTALILSKEAQSLNERAAEREGAHLFHGEFQPSGRHEHRGDADLHAAGSRAASRSTWSAAARSRPPSPASGSRPLSIGANSQVVWGMKKLELALALDNTGSMASSQQDDEPEDRREKSADDAEERGQEGRRRQGRDHPVRHHRQSRHRPTRTTTGSTSTRSIATAGNPAAAATRATGRTTGKAACATAPIRMTRRMTAPDNEQEGHAVPGL